MSRSQVSASNIRSFSLSELEKYLRLTKWIRAGQRRASVEYKKHFASVDELLTLLVPTSNQTIDYLERIYDLLSMISSVSDRSIPEIISDIVQVSNDIMKMRVESLKSYTRSIPLDIAALEVDSLKRLLVFGASSEEKPRPFFDKATTIGMNHGNHCHFGHTFEGSFGFTINSPIQEDYTQLTLDNEPQRVPFERKVLERIATGFVNTKEAISTQNPDIIVENFEIGFNSKMCDAIVEMSAGSSNILNFNISWSPQIGTAPIALQGSTIQLGAETIEIVGEASKKLKTVEPFEEDIIGKIITLHANKEPFSDEDFPRIAIVRHTYQDRPIEVKLELTMDQYKVAYTAHGEGATIRAKGRLYRKGNSWRMIELTLIERFHS